MARIPNLRERLANAGLAPRTADLYYRTIRAAEWWCEENGLDLHRVTAMAIARYADTLPNTYASRNVLRASLRWYWELTGRRRTPLGAIRTPRRRALVCRALMEDEAAILANHARGRNDGPGLVVLLALYGALRRSEIAALRWDSIGDGWLTLVGKGNKEGAIPIHPELVRALIARPRVADYVFPGQVNGHVHPATVWDWFRRVTVEAGIGEVSTHVGRHTALATTLDRTGDLRATMEFARHSRPETTAGYTRTTARRLREVVEALDYSAPDGQGSPAWPATTIQQRSLT